MFIRKIETLELENGTTVGRILMEDQPNNPALAGLNVGTASTKFGHIWGAEGSTMESLMALGHKVGADYSAHLEFGEPKLYTKDGRRTDGSTFAKGDPVPNMYAVVAKVSV